MISAVSLFINGALYLKFKSHATNTLTFSAKAHFNYFPGDVNQRNPDTVSVSRHGSLFRSNALFSYAGRASLVLFILGGCAGKINKPFSTSCIVFAKTAVCCRAL